MTKRVKLSLFSALIFFVIVLIINLLIPFLRNQQRVIDIFAVAFISSLFYYFVNYFLIKALEKNDEKKVQK